MNYILQTIEPAKTCSPVEQEITGELLVSSYSAYGSDESKLSPGAMSSLVFAQSAADVSSLLATRYEKSIPTTFSGARTGLVGGAVSPEGGHILSLERLKGIGVVQGPNTSRPTVRVEAGVSLQQLDDYLLEVAPGWFFPVDPTERSASFGGMLSTNASGARSYRFGSVRNWVEGLEVVLANGSCLSLRRGECSVRNGQLQLRSGEMCRCVEFNAINRGELACKQSLAYPLVEGVDVVDLLIGAEGTLAAITAAQLILHPRPSSCLYLLQFFDDEEKALQFIEDLDCSELQPLAIEFFDARSLQLAAGNPQAKNCRAAAQIKDSYRAGVYSEIPLVQESAMELVVAAVEEFLERIGSSMESSIAGTEDKDLRDLKMFRHMVPEAINALVAQRKVNLPGLHKLATDMSVPKRHRRQICAIYRQQLDELGLDYAIFGHGGDAHFHVNILPRSIDQLNRAKEAYREIAKRVVALGGAVSAEHGLGRIKKDFLRLQFDPATLAELRKLKEFFDDKNLLNPGVIWD